MSWIAPSQGVIVVYKKQLMEHNYANKVKQTCEQILKNLYAGRYNHILTDRKDGYRVFKSKVDGDNKPVSNGAFDVFFDMKQAGYFEFSTSNNGYFLYYHQVVHYCEKGYKAHLKGHTISQETHEIDHVDGNNKNNKPGNLALIPKDWHRVATKICNRCFITQETRTNFIEENLDAVPVFDPQGNLIKSEDYASIFGRYLTGKMMRMANFYEKEKIEEKSIPKIQAWKKRFIEFFKEAWGFKNLTLSKLIRKLGVKDEYAEAYKIYLNPQSLEDMIENLNRKKEDEFVWN